MPLLSRFGIAQRLYAVIAVLTIALVGVALFATSRLSHVVSLADTTERTRLPQLARMSALELNVTRISLQLRHAMLARTPDEQAAALADIGAKRKAIDEALAR